MEESGSLQFLPALNAEQKRLWLKTWPIILGFVALWAGSYTALDVYASDNNRAYSLVGLLLWALEYLLLVIIMEKCGYFSNGKKSGVGTYVVLGMAKGIFIGLALVVLIVPGLYLMMRWLPAYARALTTDDWVGTSLRWSWDATENFQKPLAIGLIGPVACLAIGLLLTVFYFPDDWALDAAVLLVSNIMMSLGLVWLTVLGVACFGTLLSFGLDSEKLTQTNNPA